MMQQRCRREDSSATETAEPEMSEETAADETSSEEEVRDRGQKYLLPTTS